jgi:hypothetical protein
MSLDMPEQYKKFVELNETGELVKQYVCPVEGCTERNSRSPGAIISHILLVADPDVKGHREFDKGSHKAYLDSQGGPEVLKTFPKYLSDLPRTGSS